MTHNNIFEILNISKTTQNQKKAILKNNTPILVTASAGSGKTFVLTSRYLYKVLRKKNPSNPKKILLLTFAKNAAAEMYERIVDKLENVKHIETKKLVKKKNITTIDSFCYNTIKENIKITNISPNFKIATKNDVMELKNKVITNIFQNQYKKNKNKFQYMCDYFNLNSSSGLKDVILLIYEKSKTKAFPKLYISNLKNENSSKLISSRSSAKYG